MYGLYWVKIIPFDTTFLKDYKILSKFWVCPTSSQHYFVNHSLTLLNFTLKVCIRSWWVVYKCRRAPFNFFCWLVQRPSRLCRACLVFLYNNLLFFGNTQKPQLSLKSNFSKKCVKWEMAPVVNWLQSKKREVLDTCICSHDSLCDVLSKWTSWIWRRGMFIFMQGDSCVVGLGFWGLCTSLQFCIPTWACISIPLLQKHPCPLVNFSLGRPFRLRRMNLCSLVTF